MAPILCRVGAAVRFLRALFAGVFVFFWGGAFGPAVQCYFGDTFCGGVASWRTTLLLGLRAEFVGCCPPSPGVGGAGDGRGSGSFGLAV